MKRGERRLGKEELHKLCLLWTDSSVFLYLDRLKGEGEEGGEGED